MPKLSLLLWQNHKRLTRHSNESIAIIISTFNLLLKLWKMTHIAIFNCEMNSLNSS